MDKTVGMAEARSHLRDIVDQVERQSDTFIIHRNGRPAAAVVPIEVYESWKRQRREFFDLIRQTQKASNLTPEQAQRVAAEAVRAVRRGRAKR